MCRGLPAEFPVPEWYTTGLNEPHPLPHTLYSIHKTGIGLVNEA